MTHTTPHPHPTEQGAAPSLSLLKFPRASPASALKSLGSEGLGPPPQWH